MFSGGECLSSRGLALHSVETCCAVLSAPVRRLRRRLATPSFSHPRAACSGFELFSFHERMPHHTGRNISTVCLTGTARIGENANIGMASDFWTSADRLSAALGAGALLDCPEWENRDAPLRLQTVKTLRQFRRAPRESVACDMLRWLCTPTTYPPRRETMIDTCIPFRPCVSLEEFRDAGVDGA